MNRPLVLGFFGLLLFGIGFFTAWWFKPGPKIYLAPPQGLQVYGQHDLILGKKDAPKLGVYTSYRCPYCMEFYRECWATLRTQYIATGRLCVVLRLTPGAGHTNDLKAARYMHCLAPEQRLDGHDKLQNWEPKDSLWPELALAAFDSPKLRACVADKNSRQAVLAAQMQAEEDGIPATPSFWFPDRVVVGYEGKNRFFERVREMVE